MVLTAGDQLPPVPLSLGAVASVAGIAFHHLYARRVEIDFVVWNLLGLAGALGLFFVYAGCAWLDLSLFASLYYFGVAVAWFAASLAASILLYRGYFHPLSHIPGPRLARFTSFWAVREASGDYRFHVRLKELHEQYGDVVRIGPRLVSVARADALPLTANLGKGTFFSHAGGRDDTKQGFGLSRDPEDHRVRRRPWEIAFSPKHLVKHTERLQDAIGRCIDGRLAPADGAPERRVDIANALSRLSFDITGIVGFGHSFGAIEREGPEAHPALTAMRKAHAVLGGLRYVPWLMSMMRLLPVGKGDFAPFIDHSEKILAEHEAERRRAGPDGGKAAHARPHEGNDSDEDDDRDPTPKPVLSFLLDAMERGDPSGPRTREALVGESRSMIAAGADTVQSAMINCLGYLATHETARRRLQTRADATFPGGPATYTYARLLADAETLAWADAVVNETLRILPPAPSANARVTGPAGLVVPASAFGPRFWIPGGTELIQPPYVYHRDPRWFDRPDEFLPERWMDGRLGRSDEDVGGGGDGGSGSGSGTLKCDRAAFSPFHSGKHACVGKPMAIQELRSVVVRVALQFDWALAPGQTWEAYESRIMDHFTMAVPPLYLVFKERQPRKA